MHKWEFLKKAILPVVAVWMLAVLFKPLCMEQGELDWRLLILLMGIPFGIRYMFLWRVPGNFGIGGSIGVIAFNLLVGGLIGSVVMAWRLIVAIVTMITGITSGAFRVMRMLQ